MNRVLIILFISLFSILAFPQNETAIWYFGIYAGLDFTNGAPVALTDGQLNTSEGCSSICDQNGEVLFYTDGVVVYSKDHSLMENGTDLMGHWSATQSSLVLPKPSSNGIFYIFTVDASVNDFINGCRYSIVDINQNNGLGNVISKNIELFTPSCEKLASIKHQNGIDYWVIGHMWDSNSYYVYLVSSNGISEPTIYNLGLYHEGDPANSIGALKISQMGNKIVSAIRLDGKVEILDFNSQTGELSNPISFSPPNNPQLYGIEISPDGTKLYTSSEVPSEAIYQFDLQAGTPGEILNSATEICSGGSIQRCALQMGPDQKIYVARRTLSYLGVISNPNEEGLLCNYDDEAVSLNGRECLFGLPNFVQDNLQIPQTQNFYLEDQCNIDTTFFNLTNTNSLDSVLWNFGDPSSGSNNFSTEYNSCHIYNYPGSYEVTLISYFSTKIDTLYKNVTIHPSPVINLGEDTVVCHGETILLDAGFGFNSYLWQDGSINQFYYTGQTGLYRVYVTDTNTCYDIDSIYLEFILPDPGLGNDTIMCPWDSIRFYADDDFVSYLWHNNTVQNNFTADSSGIFWCEVVDTIGCVGRDTVLLNILPPPQVNLGNDTSICMGDILQLNQIFDSNYHTFLWYNGSTDSIINISEQGNYWVEVTNVCGSIRDSISLSLMQLPEVFLGNDTVLLINNELTLNPGDGFENYLWSDGSQQPTLTISENGSYWVNVFDGQCYNSDTINIEPIDCDLFIPIVFTPNSDGYNDYFYSITSSEITDFQLTVFNRWGELIWETEDKDGKWDGQNGASKADEGTYFWVLRYKCSISPIQFEKKGSVTLLR